MVLVHTQPSRSCEAALRRGEEYLYASRASLTADDRNTDVMFRFLCIALVLEQASAFMMAPAASLKVSVQKVAMQHGGKGFGGGEATRDPEPTFVDPNDPKGKQQAIHKAESFAEYLAKRGGATAGSAGHYPNLPPSVTPGVLTGQAVTDLLEDAKKRGCVLPSLQ